MDFAGSIANRLWVFVHRNGCFQHRQRIKSIYDSTRFMLPQLTSRVGLHQKCIKESVKVMKLRAYVIGKAKKNVSFYFMFFFFLSLSHCRNKLKHLTEVLEHRGTFRFASLYIKVKKREILYFCSRMSATLSNRRQICVAYFICLPDRILCGL